MNGLLYDIALGLKDVRGTLRHFGIFLGCIILGVFAISGVNSLANSLTQGLGDQSRTILGGDVSYSFIHRQANPAELGFFTTSGKVDSAATLRAMARTLSGDPALVELKAVEPVYPAIGALKLSPGLSLSAALGRENGTFGLAVDPALLARLDAKIGDSLKIGDLTATIRATIITEPDQLGGGLGLGPRVMMLQSALSETNLLQPGALVRWTYRVSLADPRLTPEAAIADANKSFPEAGWQARSRLSVSPDFEKNIVRFADFLTLVGLTALLVGGVGVASAVRAFVERKRGHIAILKAVGASGSRVFNVMLVEILTVATLGIIIGLALGAALPFVLAGTLRSVIPFPFEPSIGVPGLALGALFGYGTALIFSIPQLGRARDIPVSALFRDSIDSYASRPRASYLIVTAVLALALFGLAIAASQNHKLAAYYLIGSLVVLAALRGLAAGIMALARRLPPIGPLPLRLAIRNIHAPRALTPALTLAIGLGLTLLITIALVDVNLRQNLAQGQAGKTPSFFFLDIRGSESTAFGDFLKSQAPDAKIEKVVMMRGRITALNGEAAEKIKPEDNAAWVLEGDRGITFADSAPEGSSLTSGTWWNTDYKGEPLVSMEQEIATGLHLKLNDTISVNVLGRTITARIANLRKVDWRSFGINFVMVFSPNTFAGAPTTFLATLTPPQSAATPDVLKSEMALLKSTAAQFPTVTTLRVKDALETVQNLVRQLSLAIRAASSVVLIAALLVLAGALSAAQNARSYEAVILKTLGATRARLLGSYALEFFIIGATTALLALACATLAAYAIITLLMKFTFAMPWGLTLATIAVSVFLIILIGLVGTWRSLALKPAARLRTL